MGDLRVEHKYLVPERLRDSLRAIIAPFVRPDRHATPRHDHGASYFGYTVRSIYYDTSTFEHFFANESGLADRAKPRIRGYGNRAEDALVFLEIKRRTGQVGSKSRAPIPYAAVDSLLESGATADFVRPSRTFPDAVADAGRFMYRLRRFSLQPVVLVSYEREPYVGTIESSLRITFDTNIRSFPYPRIAGLFEDHQGPESLPRHFVLEVKHDSRFGFPVWLRPFMGKHGLVRRSLSKYYTCLTDLNVVHAQTKMRSLALGDFSPAAGAPYRAGS